MEKVSNSVELLTWHLRRLLNVPQKTVAPVVWRPALMTSRHLPSRELRHGLTAEQNERADRIVQELHIVSRLSTRFPKKLGDAEWKTLLELKTRKARLDQVLFYFKVENLREKEREHKKSIVGERDAPQNAMIPDRNRCDSQQLVLPSVLRNSSSSFEEYTKFRRVLDAFRLESSPILAVDCQFLSRLSHRGRELTALQLQYLVAANRSHSRPFRLFFVNYDPRDETIRELERKKLMGLRNRGVCPVTTEKGVADAFSPSQKVIYLSPDAEEELETVEDDCAYVLGGIVDRVVEPGIPRKASLEAARAARVSARKLPIDRFVDFKSGSKFLTLLAVADILREVNCHGDWRHAMSNAIPVRNTRSSDEKNRKSRDTHARIREFNRRVLEIVDRKMGKLE